MLNEFPDRNDEITAVLLNESRTEAFRWAAREIKDEFTDATWAMFWNTAVEGRSTASVSDSLGRSTGAVYVARYRVTQRIKEKINEISDIWSFEQ